MSKATVMRVDRTLCEVDASFITEHAENLGYICASDNVWVPVCDLDQYEAGLRSPVHDRVEVVLRFTVKRELVPGAFYDPQEFADYAARDIERCFATYKPEIKEKRVMGKFS